VEVEAVKARFFFLSLQAARHDSRVFSFLLVSQAFHSGVCIYIKFRTRIRVTLNKRREEGKKKN
jgi:hypothetical protein